MESSFSLRQLDSVSVYSFETDEWRESGTFFNAFGVLMVFSVFSSGNLPQALKKATGVPYLDGFLAVGGYGSHGPVNTIYRYIHMALQSTV